MTPPSSEPPDPSLHEDDLTLAAGCVRQEPLALTTFDERYLKPLRSFVSEIDNNPARLDELKQLVRERLLVADAPGTAPRIASYTGRGTLGAWVQIVARRLALSSLRQRVPVELRDDDSLEAQLLVGTDPELDYIRLRYAQEFRQALEDSLQELSSHERLLLRLHLLDGASLTRIAQVYRVSQSTISRRLQQARDSIGSRMKERLNALHGLTASEFESLLHLVESRFELSLARALQSEAEVALRSLPPSPTSAS
jgi:RNA polymerase sigma-70 factor (ECF subfamily)